MSEIIIGIINNVQAKGKTSLVKKTCTIIVTNERLICVPLGTSTMISAMIGQSIAGPSGAIGLSQDTMNKSNQKLKEIKSKDLNQILSEEKDSFEIPKTNINKGNMKTGFFSTLGIWIPLTIYAPNRFYFDIPIGEKENSKLFISNFSEKIIIK